MNDTCGRCRHANHGTEDAALGDWACPWIGPTTADSPCRLRHVESGAAVFEAYDGANGTWGSADPLLRSVPAGYEGRAVRRTDGRADASFDLTLEPDPPGSGVAPRRWWRFWR